LPAEIIIKKVSRWLFFLYFLYMRKVFFIFLFLLNYSVLACEDINLFETSSTLRELEIVNQGAMNTCYAHTLAALYNSEFGQIPEKRVDPYWIAFVHKTRWLHWQPRQMDYSLLSLAWSDLKKYGYCDQHYLRSILTHMKRGVNYSDDQFFYLLNHFFKAKTFRDARRERGFQRIINRLMSKLPERSQAEFEIPWSKADLVKILNPLRFETHRKEFFHWLELGVFANCRSNITNEPQHYLTSTGRFHESNDDLANLVEGLLTQSKTISVGYCGKIFQDPLLEVSATPRLLKAAQVKCGAHYSLIVGSRKQGTKCQYLVRNSYGTGFWAADDFSCWCRNKLSGKGQHCNRVDNNSNLEVLGCWIDSHQLLNNTYDLSYF
jgi:hypothetical protein